MRWAKDEVVPRRRPKADYLLLAGNNNERTIKCACVVYACVHILTCMCECVMAPELRDPSFFCTDRLESRLFAFRRNTNPF